jgi:hypothetical protein
VVPLAEGSDEKVDPADREKENQRGEEFGGPTISHGASGESEHDH